MEAVELKNIAGGALQAKFNKAMEAVVANLLDPNTPSKDKRKITIEMTFVTDEERTQVASTVSVKQKLAPLHPINTQFGIGKDLKDGGNFIEEYGFVEVDQPASQFIFRMKQEQGMGIRCALFEADGGAWKNQACQNIEQYLKKELSDVTEPRITVIS